MNYIEENLIRLKKEIAETAAKSGRNPDDITILAATKTVPEDIINQYINMGQFNIGENRVQELTGKYENVDKRALWHFIGHLQTNKVKYIIDKVEMIHSVDRLKLAKEINKRAKAIDKIMNVLIQINIADEDSKFGIHKSKALDFAKDLCQFSNINVKGLMCLAPYVENPEKNRDYFIEMKQLLVDINGKMNNNNHMTTLSMGMTLDYKVAIEEGATIIRVGTGLFGKR